MFAETLIDCFYPTPASSQRAGETMRIAGTEAGRDGIYTVSTRNGIQYAEFIKILNSQFFILNFFTRPLPPPKGRGRPCG